MCHAKPRLPFAFTLPSAALLRIVDSPAPAKATGFTVDTPTSGLMWARLYRTRLRLSDATIIIVVVAITLFARFGFEGASAEVVGLQADYSVVSLLIIVVWIGSLGAFHTRDSRVVGVGANEYKRVINASGWRSGCRHRLRLPGDIARGYSSPRPESG
jgi:hypothetical protein